MNRLTSFGAILLVGGNVIVGLTALTSVSRNTIALMFAAELILLGAVLLLAGMLRSSDDNQIHP